MLYTIQSDFPFRFPRIIYIQTAKISSSAFAMEEYDKFRFYFQNSLETAVFE